MSEAEHHLEALSPDCETYLSEQNMYSVADHKDDTDPADIFTIEGHPVIIQVRRDISLDDLRRLVEHGREQYAKGRTDLQVELANLLGVQSAPT